MGDAVIDDEDIKNKGGRGASGSKDTARGSRIMKALF